MNQPFQKVLNFIQEAEFLSAEEKATLTKEVKNTGKDLKPKKMKKQHSLSTCIPIKILKEIMNKKLFLFFILFNLSISLVAQEPFLDSLNNNLSNARTNVQKANALIDIADYFQYKGLTDTAIVTLKKALIIANQTDAVNKQLEVLSTLVGIYFRPGPAERNDTIIDHLISTALDIARKAGLHGWEAQMLSVKSAFMYVTGNNKDSVKLLTQQAFQILKDFPDDERAAMVSWLQSRVNRYGNIDSGMRYANQAVELAERSGQPKVEVLTLMNAAEFFSLQQKPDSANQRKLAALSVARKNHLLYNELDILSSFLNVHAGVIRDSLNQFYNEALSINRYMDNAHDSLNIMNDYAQANGSIGNYPRELQNLLLALNISEKRKDTTHASAILANIIEMYMNVGDYKSANQYTDKLATFSQPVSFIGVNVDMYYALNYAFLNQKDSAAFYAQRTEKNAKTFFIDDDKTNAWGGIIFGGIYNTLGRAYLKMGNDSLAKDRLQKSYYYFTHIISDYSNLYEVVYGLALYFEKVQQQDSAYWYAKQIIDIAAKQNFAQYTPDASRILVNYFQIKHLPDSALFYQQIGDKAYKSLFNAANASDFLQVSLEEQQRLQQISADQELKEQQYKNNLKMYALLAVLFVAIIVAVFILRNNRQKQKAYTLLQQQKQETDDQKQKVESALVNLKATQSQLIQSEKMASLGELTAGIAHEIQNPLNFVNNFSEVNTEMVDELQAELKSGNVEEAITISNDIKENSEKINHHGKRADAIVKGMLQHSRSSTGVKEPTNINALADEYLRLTYQGLRAKDKDFNAEIKTDFDATIGKINIIPQDIGRVLLNLYNNAFYAVNEKHKECQAEPVESGYEPTVSVRTKKSGNSVTITVKDNGGGIPEKVKEKIFQPFFTTKPAGNGTGLGLSLSYDIVKAHGGGIRVESKEGEGSEFVIQLPVV